MVALETWLSWGFDFQKFMFLSFLSSLSNTVSETSNHETKNHTRRVGELRFIMPAGPEELTLQLWALNKGVIGFL